MIDLPGDSVLVALGLAFELQLGVVYLVGAARRSPRGRRWPAVRTVSFVLGLVVICVSVDSGIETHDSLPAVHALQHVLLMMVAPPLMAWGRPMTLALRSFRGVGRRRLLSVLQEPSVRRMGRRPRLLVLDYTATMAVVMLGPVSRFLERSPCLHFVAHGYLVVCGFLFWTVVLAADPVPGRLAVGVRRAMVWWTVGLTALLGVVVVACGSADGTGSAGVLVGGALLGAVVFSGVTGRAQRSPRANSARKVPSEGVFRAEPRSADRFARNVPSLSGSVREPAG